VLQCVLQCIAACIAVSVHCILLHLPLVRSTQPLASVAKRCSVCCSVCRRECCSVCCSACCSARCSACCSACCSAFCSVYCSACCSVCCSESCSVCCSELQCLSSLSRYEHMTINIPTSLHLSHARLSRNVRTFSHDDNTRLIENPKPVFRKSKTCCVSKGMFGWTKTYF